MPTMPIPVQPTKVNHQRFNSIGGVQPAERGRSQSTMGFDSMNVRKTTVVGIRSSGFFPLSKDDRQKPNMAYRKNSFAY